MKYYSANRLALFAFSLQLAYALAGTAAHATCSGNQPPTNYFSLSNWNLTIPIDSSGNLDNATSSNLAETIPADTLIGSSTTPGFFDHYFFSDCTGHLVFDVPTNGAALVLGGQGAARSELRELYSGPNPAPSPNSEDWLSTTGGTLSGSASIQSVPSATMADEVTIAQIHNESCAFILLIYKAASNAVYVRVHSKYNVSDPTSSTTCNTGAETDTLIAPNVGITGNSSGLSDKIAYVMSYSAPNTTAAPTLTITVNGNTVMPEVDPSWNQAPVYFKLGAYSSAANSASPVGDTHITYSTFTVSHPAK